LAVLPFGSVFGSFGLVEHLVKFGHLVVWLNIWFKFGHLVVWLNIWFFWLFGSVSVKLRQPPR
jgi:hypothetical protein